MVYVLSQSGNPLMPTNRHGKVRHLLNTGEARVVKMTPFTIQFLKETNLYTQPITLGIDAGSKTVGLSASTDKQEVFAAEVMLRTDIVDLLATKRQNRRTRRNRLRYRKARFLNRTSTKKKGWLAPSIKHKIDSHLTLVAKLYKILPITNIVVEVASFDIQKIKNPNISGIDYQQGDQLDFWNVREYVFFRDGHKCQHCKGKSKDKILNVHHIESRKTGGDAPNNLITLCETCHDLHHKGKIKLKVKRGLAFRDAAFMGIMRWALFNKLKNTYPNVSLTYGYLTKNTRITLGFEKSHAIDAYCIAGNTKAKRSTETFLGMFKRKRNRQIHKANFLKGGKKKLNQAPYLVHGYRLFDKIAYEGQTGFIFGRRSTGYFDIRTLSGDKIHASASYKKLKLIEKSNSLLFERRKGVLLS